MLNPEYQTELLKMIWPFQAGGRFVSGGNEIEVRKTGEYDRGCDRFCGAEAVIDGVVFRGDVIFGAPASGELRYDSCILQVVPRGDTARIIREDNTFLPQVTVEAGSVTQTAYRMLRDGAGGYGCAVYVHRMESHERVALFTRLLADRLRRKCDDLMGIYGECEQNWNETMYVMLLRTMGDSRNKQAFTELARRVKFGCVAREMASPEHVEALLLGTSGLLELYDDDNYIRRLKEHYEHLRKKYNITAMMPREWTISQTNPNNHPVLRIAQLAAFLSTGEFLFDNMVACKSVEDIHKLFRAEASDYWSTHYIPSRESGRRPKRIGHFKANILGINLAVPLIFAYGDHMGDERLKDTALDLLEKINCEDNRIVNGWRAGGAVMESAFDSQAVLQLNNEYCLKGNCRHCNIGRRVIKEIYGNEHSRIMGRERAVVEG